MKHIQFFNIVPSYLVGSMTTLDSVLLAVMEMDMSQVMNELCNTLDNFWYPAHLLDLLHHSGSLESNLGQQNEQIQAGASLREFLLLEYATCLMTHNSLWQVGALYLDHCPVQGKQRLELLLERVPLTSGTSYLRNNGCILHKSYFFCQSMLD